MADLNDTQAAQSVKIVGSNVSGVETNPLPITSQGARIDSSFSNASQNRISVTNSGQQLLAANADRKWALIINNSGTTITLGFGTTPTSGQGLNLLAAAAYEINRNNLFTGSIHAIKSGGGSSTVDVIEGT